MSALTAATVGGYGEDDASPWVRRAVDSVAPGYVVAWKEERFQLFPIAEVEDAVEAEPSRWVLHLECGAWWGDGVHEPLSRTFAMVCGRTVALCQFATGEKFDDLIGPAPEVDPLNTALRGLSGPQRRDVQVLRTLGGTGK